MKTLDDYHGRRQQVFLPHDSTPIVRSADDFAVSDESVANLVEEVLQQEVVSVERLHPDTARHGAWALDLEYGESVVFRANSYPENRVDFPMVVGAGITRHLAGRGFPVAGTRCVDLTRQRFPTDFAIESEAHGLPLSYLDDERLLAPLLAQWGNWIARLHAEADVEDWGWIAIDPADPIGNRSAERPCYRGLSGSWTDFLALNFGDHLGRCVEIKAIDRAEANRIEGWFARLKCVLESAPAALLHNDLRAANAFTDGRRIAALVDWEDSLIGDPLFDLAGWAIRNPARRHAAFFHGYFGKAMRPAEFAARFWFSFTRIAVAQTAAGLGSQSAFENSIRVGLAELERLDRARWAA